MHEHELQFHIKCKAGDVGRYCFLPGDPGRCEKIAAYFDNPVKVQSNRVVDTVIFPTLHPVPCSA